MNPKPRAWAGKQASKHGYRSGRLHQMDDALSEYGWSPIRTRRNSDAASEMSCNWWPLQPPDICVARQCRIYSSSPFSVYFYMWFSTLHFGMRCILWYCFNKKLPYAKGNCFLALSRLPVRNKKRIRYIVSVYFQKQFLKKKKENSSVPLPTFHLSVYLCNFKINPNASIH